MKKFFITLLIIISAFSVPATLHAAQWGLGVTTLYNAWEPSWDGFYDSTETDPILVYGIVLSVSFLENFNFNLLAMAGESDGDVTQTGTGVSGPYTADIGMKISRNDIDAVLSYRLFERFSIFCGFKYLVLDVSPENYTLTYNSTTVKSDEGNSGGAIKGIGGGVGLSYSHPVIAQKLYAILNASFIYLQSDVDFASFDPDATDQFMHDGPVAEYRTYGANATLSLSYYIESFSTALVIGGRYQYLRYSAIDEDIYSLKDDIMYGLTLSAVYYF